MKCINKDALGFICIGFGAGIILVAFVPKWCFFWGGIFICCGIKILNE
ncbi:MAG TPA: hypothetical protein IAD10_08140 [Candidatus Fimicola cottocaccae]|nr:hypothetical protein [Tyzzerella sp. An114]HIT73614.1 hypothetical protein [Candidatus Fimicola cottocaccae]